MLTELGNGEYSTSQDGLRGTVGRTYKLRVELKNGEIYESTPVLMQPKPVIDTIYAEISKKDYMELNSYGKPIFKKLDGLQIYADIHGDDEIDFIRTSGIYIYQRLHYYFIGPRIKIWVYCWIPTGFNDSPYAKQMIEKEGTKMLKSAEIGFLPYPQTNSPVDDTGKLCFGLFDVVAGAFKYTAFRWRPGNAYYLSINLEDYDMPESAGCQDSFPPDFWISVKKFYESE